MAVTGIKLSINQPIECSISFTLVYNILRQETFNITHTLFDAYDILLPCNVIFRQQSPYMSASRLKLSGDIIPHH